MAKQLIESLSTDFDPSGYEDEYRSELLALIERKAAGEDVARGRARGAQADEGARPDGRPRGVAGGDQGRGAQRRARSGTSKPKTRAKSTSTRSGSKAAAKKSTGEGEEQVTGEGREVEIDGRRLSITNLDKVLYPEAGFTKGEVIDYYARIGPALLPHLRDRPLTVVRFPDGVDGKHFFEKNSPAHRPDWVRTVPIWVGAAAARSSSPSATTCRPSSGSPSSAAIELHPSLAKADDIERPTVLAFDLDPGEPATIVECCTVALRVRDLFAELGLESLPEDIGVEGDAGLRAAQRGAALRDDQALRPGRRASARELRARPRRPRG